MVRGPQTKSLRGLRSRRYAGSALHTRDTRYQIGRSRHFGNFLRDKHRYDGNRQARNVKVARSVWQEMAESTEVLTAPQSPGQNAYVERLIGSIRRECLDHLIVINETGLRRILKSYFDYYERSRTHLSLGKNAPLARAIQPPWTGPIVAIPQVGGLHHRYERIAA